MLRLVGLHDQLSCRMSQSLVKLVDCLLCATMELIAVGEDSAARRLFEG